MDKFERAKELTDRILAKCLDKMPRSMAISMTGELRAIISAIAEVMAEELEKLDRKQTEFRKKLK